MFTNLFLIQNPFLVVLFSAMFLMMILNIVFRKIFNGLKEKYVTNFETLDFSKAWVLRSRNISKVAVLLLEEHIKEQYGKESKELSGYHVFENLYLFYRSFDIVTFVVFMLYMVYEFVLKK